MAKKKRRKKKTYTYDELAYAKADLKASLHRFNYKLALLLAAIFVVLAVIYYILIAMCVVWAMPVLYTSAAVLFSAFFIINRGFSREPVSREMLPDDWTDEKKDAFIADDTERKALARKLMIPLVPVLLLVGIDILIVMVLPTLTA